MPSNSQYEDRRKRLAKEASQLPIARVKSHILQQVSSAHTVIIVGETGSGKTTQIPQFLHAAGYTKRGRIAITQPRRVAAISIATRVSQEMGTHLGGKVGYSIRFEDVTSPQTVINYLTDGMLLRELLSDRLLSKYSVIILDEAHERTFRTDILFGMVKLIQKKRPQLKVIVMSATLDADKFSRYFDGAPIINVEGRMFPVRLFHAETVQDDYLDASLVSIFQIHQEQPPGDILCFLTGQEDIEAAEKIINENSPHLPSECPKLIACPIFASMPTAQQNKVFEPAPPGTRKVILATNIAETSITINGIRYLIDTGMVKVRSFNPNIGLETLAVQPVSRASAEQRLGRAGREAPGICYRLYTREAYLSLDADSVPEIQRVNLASVILLLKASGVDDVVRFEYMDKPNKAALIKALEELYALGALDDQGKLSSTGKTMAEFPLDPPFAKLLITSQAMRCTKDIIAIIAMLSVDSVFFVPHEKRSEAAAAMKTFLNHDGDHLTLLNVLRAYTAHKGDLDWCNEYFIKKRAMKQVLDVQKQLTQLVRRLGLDPEAAAEGNQEVLLKCLLSGFFLKVALLQVDGSYKTLVSNQVVHIHPSSALFGKKVPMVMFNELVHTSKNYMRKVSIIQREWLMEVASHYYGRHSLS